MSTLVIEQTALSLKETYPTAFYEDGCLWNSEGDCLAKDIDPLIETYFDGTSVPIPHGSGNPEMEGTHMFHDGADYIKEVLEGDYNEAYKSI